MRTTFFTTLLFVGGLVIGCAQSVVNDPGVIVEGDIAQNLDAFLQSQANEGFSGTVLLAREGRIVLHKGYGYAHREQQVRVSTQTVFDVGSFAKSFTRAAILKLEDEGQLALDDPITKYMDGVPADKARITIRHLLNMQSGLHEYHDVNGDFEEMTRQEAERRIFDQTLRFVPGEEDGYSNSGYGLLAMIIENISGESYRDYIKNQFLDPLGLDKTGFYQDPHWVEDEVAHGYEAQTFGTQNSPYHWPEITWACIGGGCLMSTPYDLYTWYEAQSSGRILSAAGTQKYYARAETRGMSANDFGFTGAMSLDTSHTLVATTNSGAVSVRRLVQAAHDIMAGREPQETLVQRRGRGGNPDGEPVDGDAAEALAMDMIATINAGDSANNLAFIEQHFAPSQLEEMSAEETLQYFDRLHERHAPIQVGGVDIHPDGAVSLMTRGGGSDMRIRFEMIITGTPPLFKSFNLQVGG